MSVEQNKQDGSTRRELLKSVGRYGLLVGLVGGVGALAARTSSQCVPAGCAGCRLLAGCDLEAAQAARATRAGTARQGGRS